MWRSFRTLHGFQPPATPEGVNAAALQYVGKLSGTARPPRVYAEPFDQPPRPPRASC
ncbi:MAG: DUF2277 family protein [Mycobacteriales bacterium]